MGLAQTTEFLTHGWNQCNFNLSKTGQRVIHLKGLTLANTHIHN